jgi:hypothetical protein
MSRTAKDEVFDALAHLPAERASSDRFVWLLIADRQNDAKGYAWCSSNDLAARSGLTAGWIRHHSIPRLEELGLIMVIRRPGRVNRYTIVIPNLRAERAGPDDEGRALSARGRAVNARGSRAERARNQLENQLVNLAPDGAEFSSPCGHRWITEDGYCGTCSSEAARANR